jgi:hypothetical protein
VDATFRVAGPQLEQQPFATSLVLPPVAAPAAATRAADVATLIGTAFADAFGAGAAQGWVVVEAMLPQAAPTGVNQTLVQVDDGSSNNRILLRNDAGTANMLAYRVTAGAGASPVTPLVGAAGGAVFRCGMAWDAAGNVRSSGNGGAIVTLTGAPNGLIALRLGNNNSTTGPLSGRIRGLWCGYEQPSDAQLQAATVLGADVGAAIKG